MERGGAKGGSPVVNPPASAKRKLLACFFEQNAAWERPERVGVSDDSSNSPQANVERLSQNARN